MAIAHDGTLERLARDRAASLCDPCLGRLFARNDDGRTNAERGASLRRLGAHTTPSACGLCEGVLQRVDEWARLAIEEADGYDFDTFLVGSVTFPEIRRREDAIWAALATNGDILPPAGLAPKPNAPPWPLGEWLKTEINREVGKRIEASLGKRVEPGRPDITFQVDTRFDRVSLIVADLYVRGRYRKFARDLPQTRWPCRACGGIGCRQCGGRGKTYETSVEELVAAPFLSAAQSTGEAFHGMGREDIDARTLGNGRPFILEIKEPKRRNLDWGALERSVNEANTGTIEVEGIAPARHDDAARYKAADPAKTYRARCMAASPVEAERVALVLKELVGAELEQRTPQRVAHRRADLTRRRTIQELRLLACQGTGFEIEVRADSGTYIKEFVSGDAGRTRPSLSDRLGVACRVEELDVIAVHWSENGHVQ